MLIAEEFLLLCLDDESGRKLAESDRMDPALAAALLVELALRERVGITGEEEGRSRRGRLTITSVVPTDDVELDRALEAVAANEGRKIKDLVSSMSSRRLSKGLRDRLLERLVNAGVLQRDERTVLGLIPWTTWPTRDRLVEEEIRRRLHAALVAGEMPTEQTVALIALLQATGLLTKVIEVSDPKALKARAKELSESDWAATAVKQAIDEAAAVMMTVVVAGAT